MLLDIYNPAVKSQETWLKTDLMDFGTGDLGFTWENDPVKRRKVAKKVLPAFSTKALKAKEPTVQMYINLFVDRMKELGGASEGLDIHQVRFLLHTCPGTECNDTDLIYSGLIGLP